MSGIAIAPNAPTAAVHQVLPNVSFGDAISNHALWLQQALRTRGFRSEIFASSVDPRLAQEVHRWTEDVIRPRDGLFYHHSIGTAVTPAMMAHVGPKCLVYHNITPHRFFEPYLPLHARLCREGRDELPELAPHFPVSVGDSNYNAVELAECGFDDPGTLPICIDPAKLQRVPDAPLMRRLQDGRTNVLFVGRLCPNKKQEDLIAAFACMRELDPTARLILVGTPVVAKCLYTACLKRLCRELGVEDAVEFTGMVTDEQLTAYYRTAHLFFSMSEHEGFCVPLIESMWFDVPVLAYASSAVPETLGGAGRMFASKRDLHELAVLAESLARDLEVRGQVIDGQRARRNEFLEGPVLLQFDAVLAKMLRTPMVAAHQAEKLALASLSDDARRIYSALRLAVERNRPVEP